MAQNKAQLLWDMTKMFLQMYPDAEWGDAHTVLSDGNYYDDWIEETIEALINPNAPKDTENRNLEQWVLQTVAFLRFILTIPEDDRFFEDDETN